MLSILWMRINLLFLFLPASLFSVSSDILGGSALNHFAQPMMNHLQRWCFVDRIKPINMFEWGWSVAIPFFVFPCDVVRLSRSLRMSIVKSFEFDRLSTDHHRILARTNAPDFDKNKDPQLLSKNGKSNKDSRDGWSWLFIIFFRSDDIAMLRKWISCEIFVYPIRNDFLG